MIDPHLIPFQIARRWLRECAARANFTLPHDYDRAPLAVAIMAAGLVANLAHPSDGSVRSRAFQQERLPDLASRRFAAST